MHLHFFFLGWNWNCRVCRLNNSRREEKRRTEFAAPKLLLHITNTPARKQCDALHRLRSSSSVIEQLQWPALSHKYLRHLIELLLLLTGKVHYTTAWNWLGKAVCLSLDSSNWFFFAELLPLLLTFVFIYLPALLLLLLLLKFCSG